MLESSKKILTVACAIAVSVSALTAVLLIFDVVSNEELKEILSKTLALLGVLTAALIVIVLLLRTSEKK
jgi:hypothetical protein